MSITKALIDVQDKTGLVRFATSLIENGIEIFAYNATANYLKKHKIPHNTDPDWTFLTYPTANEEHIVGKRSRYHVDLLVVNLPDIEATINKIGQTQMDVLEQINIVNISNIRLAAVNYNNIIPVISYTDYDQIIDDIQTGKLDNPNYRIKYAQKVFGYTSKYDSIVSQYLYLSSC